MGIIWSRFKKKESTKDKLKKIQEDITILEEYGEHTEQRRKKLVGSLIAYSIFFYLLAAIICYFYYLPPTVEEKLLYATPFIGFIVFIYIIKRLLTWYYRWKVRRNENKLSALKEKKTEILNQVMETETYKIAKEILEIYAPEQFRKASMTIKSPISTTPVVTNQRMSLPQSGEVRRRIITPQPAQSFTQRPLHTPSRPVGSSTPMPYGRHIGTPRPGQVIRPNISTPSLMQGGPRPMYSPISPMNAHPYIRSDGGIGHPNNNSGSDAPGPPMPRPILPRERGMLDRFVEYLVGDGPANRYALVCKQCESHNGMALKDEFPYIAFRCAYCFYWNPARKQKPAPPRLETIQQRPSLEIAKRMMEKELEEASSSSEEDEESESDSSSAANSSSDEEEKERVQESKTNSESVSGQGTKVEKTEIPNTEAENAVPQKSEPEISDKVTESSVESCEKVATIVADEQSTTDVREKESVESL